MVGRVGGCFGGWVDRLIIIVLFEIARQLARDRAT